MRSFIAMTIFCLLFSAFSFPIGVLASDYNNHWAKQSITTLIEADILKGDENQNVNPNDLLTKAEAITIINQVFNFTNNEGTNFSDVESYPWYADQFKIAKNEGYLKGDENGWVYPENILQREEVCAILAQILGLPDSNFTTNFLDQEDISSWALKPISLLNENGIVKPYADNTFRPQKGLCRAEFFSIITPLLNEEEGVLEKVLEDNSEERVSEDEGINNEETLNEQRKNDENIDEDINNKE